MGNLEGLLDGHWSRCRRVWWRTARGRRRRRRARRLLLRRLRGRLRGRLRRDAPLERLRRLLEVAEHGVHVVIGHSELREVLAARDDHSARDEDEQNDLGRDEAVNEAGEELGLVRGKLGVGIDQALQTNREANVHRRDHVLDFKVREAWRKADFPHDRGKLARPLPRRRLGPRARHDHLPSAEDEGRAPRLAEPHDHGCEALRVVLRVSRG
mmetsp:Transcript_3386/g.11895  ORF Transcript_3386/g.11895 Transcript_3386/m.11895 type:complete len:212 (-) Transcript_3386:249-884(-)